MTKTREDYGLGITRPKFDEKARFELKDQFLKELHDNTFSGSDNKDANKHTKRVVEIDDLFTIPDVTQDQLILCSFPISLTGAVCRRIRNKPTSSITTWEILKGKFLSKYCPYARGRYRATATIFYQRDNGNPLYKERRQTMEESLSKFMAESAKRHDDNSNLIKEIRALMDVAIRN
uniref:Reverse transcriptase domain-containing protein n=1 Tax=Tanacetum cinerariifolium TaxID=118510 RepID=A0A699JJF4_TANCI|nr:hypothetical protein [Tanacetum cinerariifolium]